MAEPKDTELVTWEYLANLAVISELPKLLPLVPGDYICIVGKTGTGKSLTAEALKRVLSMCFPYKVEVYEECYKPSLDILSVKDVPCDSIGYKRFLLQLESDRIGRKEISIYVYQRVSQNQDILEKLAHTVINTNIDRKCINRNLHLNFRCNFTYRTWTETYQYPIKENGC
ncbi:MAG: hypothetical protein ABSD73_12485 [Candidatus Bathyarchaeia archaeon]|jgi:hypothetical protein